MRVQYDDTATASFDLVGSSADWVRTAVLVNDAVADARQRIAENRPYEDAITAEEFRRRYLP